jgi:hypothetical protein
MRPKPVKDVQTFDGRSHEVDIKLKDKTYTAWGFVDQRIIEGNPAPTQIKALANWKTAYKASLTGAAK